LAPRRQWAKANPDLVRRMVADGHMVFNHTLDHRSFTGVSDRAADSSGHDRRAELEDADAIIARCWGTRRNPGMAAVRGRSTPHVAADVQLRLHAQSGLDGGFARLARGSSTDIVRCLSWPRRGVYVFHVGRASQRPGGHVIQGLRDKGFGFTGSADS
jgi:peptidoglycan/xylan/chitin deacetylase (PgdA/CDA1 family)